MNSKVIAVLLVVVLIGTAVMMLPTDGDDDASVLSREAWIGLLLSSQEERNPDVDDAVIHIDGDRDEVLRAVPFGTPLAVRADTGEYVPLLAGPSDYKPIERFLAVCGRTPLEFDVTSANETGLEMAQVGWGSSDVAIVTGGYAESVLAGPLAAYVGCPILPVTTDSEGDVKDVLKELGVRHVVSIGWSSITGFKTLELSLDEVNDLYLDVLDSAGESSDYIVVTNTGDIHLPWSENSLPVPGISAFSSQMAAYRKAMIVRVDGYDSWDGSYGDGYTYLGVPFETATNVSGRIDGAIDLARADLELRGSEARYIGMVGGPIGLPFHYADMTAYVEERQYTPSDYQYANIDDDPEQELAIGRIAGRTPWSASNTIALTLGFEEVVDYAWEDDDSHEAYAIVSADWKENSMIVIGTTKIGPGPGILTPTLVNQTVTMSEADFFVTTLGYDAGNGDTIRELIDEMNYDVYYGHGDIDCWYSAVGWQFDSDQVNAAPLKPGFAIAMACLTGLTDSVTMASDQFFAYAMMYSGATGYIGASRVAYGLYDYEVTDEGFMRGTGALYLVDTFSKQVCEYDNDVGIALMNAKNSVIAVQGYDEAEGSDGFEGAITVNEYVLYGDPAQNLWIPYHDA